MDKQLFERILNNANGIINEEGQGKLLCINRGVSLISNMPKDLEEFYDEEIASLPHVMLLIEREGAVDGGIGSFVIRQSVQNNDEQAAWDIAYEVAMTHLVILASNQITK